MHIFLCRGALFLEKFASHRLLAAVHDAFTEGLDTPDLVAARELLAQLA
jgi:hypothetical protein